MLLNGINIAFFIILLKINILNSFIFINSYRKSFSPNRLIYSHRMSNKRFFLSPIVCVFTREYYIKYLLCDNNCFYYLQKYGFSARGIRTQKAKANYPCEYIAYPQNRYYFLLFTFYFLCYTTKELLYYHTQEAYAS